MVSKKKSALLVAGAVALLIVLWAAMRARREFQGARDTAVRSCLASIGSGIDPTPGGELLRDRAVGTEWLKLGGDGSDRVIGAVTRRKGVGDCGGETSDGLPVDPWGNHFQIAVRRRAEKGPADFVLWSAGRDGASGTDDDIVFPYDARVPK